MIPDGYRILIVYDSEEERFLAQVPELPGLKSYGNTRAEAIASVEEELDKSFRKAAEEGNELPAPLDGKQFNGEITIKISPSLHKELNLIAFQEGLEINHLLAEIISAGVARRTAPSTQPPPQENRAEEDRDQKEYRRPRRSPRGSNYFNIMDDKASFLEYVRSLENRGGGKHGRRGNK